MHSILGQILVLVRNRILNVRATVSALMKNVPVMENGWASLANLKNAQTIAVTRTGFVIWSYISVSVSVTLKVCSMLFILEFYEDLRTFICFFCLKDTTVVKELIQKPGTGKY